MPDNINLRKVEKMAFLAFKNALRLHQDAILLFRNKRFPSAYALSVLSMEEIGKYHLLEDFVWHSRVDHRYTPEQEQEIISMIYNHRYKQNKFSHHAEPYPFKRKIIKEISTGISDKNKQNSIYIGLPRKRRKINLKGQISIPLKRINQRKTEQQITLINDYLVSLTLGVLKGVYVVDIWELQEFFSHDFIDHLLELWPEMSRQAKKDFTTFSKYEDYEWDE